MEKVIEPMTSGSIGKRMMFFALPLLLGNLFQQLYNTVDSLIVGNFLGSSALAAVSSSGSLIFMLTGFLSGISAGAGVVISKYFRAEDVPNIQRAVTYHCCLWHSGRTSDDHRGNSAFAADPGLDGNS